MASWTERLPLDGAPAWVDGQTAANKRDVEQYRMRQEADRGRPCVRHISET